jgi:short-subunit dehydrogenase
MQSPHVIIVGASSGIGKRMAELYVERGCQVGITGRRTELLKELQQQFPGKIEFASFDVCDVACIDNLESLIEKLGGLDILVISAGMGEPSKELSWEIDNATVATNVNGFLRIANWGFNYFMNKSSGRMAVISSIAAVRGGSHAPAYNASKAFQSNYFEGLAVKAAKLKKPVGITCIEPGFVDTKLARSDKLFWLVPVDKAARQIIRAIDKKRRKVYISRRWWIIAKLLGWMPHWVYRRII